MSDTLSQPLADRIAKLELKQDRLMESDTPTTAQQGAIQALADGKTHYTDRPGIAPLREWVAQQINTRYEIQIDKDQITITCGIEEAIFASVMVLAQSAILVIGDATHLHGTSILKDVPLIYTSEQLSSHMLIYLTSQDAQEDITTILDHADAETCWVVWDTTQGTGTFHPAQHEKWASRTVTIGSMEDTLKGWRIGWMAGSSQAGALRSFKQSMTICSPSISQWAAYEWASKQ
ncbi:MAG: hypothetical protein ACFE0Q_08140 [Anaerolineae bacterium]